MFSSWSEYCSLSPLVQSILQHTQLRFGWFWILLCIPTFTVTCMLCFSLNSCSGFRLQQVNRSMQSLNMQTCRTEFLRTAAHIQGSSSRRTWRAERDPSSSTRSYTCVVCHDRTVLVLSAAQQKWLLLNKGFMTHGSNLHSTNSSCFLTAETTKMQMKAPDRTDGQRTGSVSWTPPWSCSDPF